MLEAGMTWLRNPWLGAMVALTALGIHARAETPMAALAIGLPFAIVVWAYWCLGPRLTASDGVMATPPAQLLAKPFAVVIVALMGAWFVYMCYGLVTEKGVIGWLNAVQATRDGKFSTKLSFVVALFYLLCAMGAIALAAVWRARRRGPTVEVGVAPQPPARVASVPLRTAAARPPNRTRLTLWMLAGLVVAPWLIGYPIYLWIAAEHREDVQSHYVRIVMGASTLAWPSEPHVALDGEVQGDQVLVLKEGNQARKTYFVPVTGAGWAPAVPVSVVLTFVAEVPPRLDRPILGRLRSDALPLAAIDAFARSGVKIAQAHRLVDLVPSQQGQVLDRSDSDRQTFLVGASMISVMSLVGALMFRLITKFKNRSVSGGLGL
jgi:hypothetical protein